MTMTTTMMMMPLPGCELPSPSIQLLLVLLQQLTYSQKEEILLAEVAGKSQVGVSIEHSIEAGFEIAAIQLRGQCLQPTDNAAVAIAILLQEEHHPIGLMNADTGNHFLK